MTKTHILLAALALGSCDQMPARFTQADSARLDAAEANLDRAARASSDLVDRVERSETAHEELEETVRHLDTRIDEVERQAAEADALRSRVEALEGRLRL